MANTYIGNMNETPISATQYADEASNIANNATGTSTDFGSILNAVKGTYPTLSGGMAAYDAKYFGNNTNFQQQFNQGQDQNRWSTWNAQQQAANAQKTTPATTTTPPAATTQPTSPTTTTSGTDPYAAYQQQFNTQLSQMQNQYQQQISQQQAQYQQQLTALQQQLQQALNGNYTNTGAVPVVQTPTTPVSTTNPAANGNTGVVGPINTTTSPVSSTPPVDTTNVTLPAIESTTNPTTGVQTIENPYKQYSDVIQQLMQQYQQNQTQDTSTANDPNAPKFDDSNQSLTQQMYNRLADLLGTDDWSTKYMDSANMQAVQNMMLDYAKQKGMSTSPTGKNYASFKNMQNIVSNLIGGQLGAEQQASLAAQRQADKEQAARDLAQYQARQRAAVAEMNQKRMDWLNRLNDLATQQNISNQAYHQQELAKIAAEAALDKKNADILKLANQMAQGRQYNLGTSIANNIINSNQAMFAANTSPSARLGGPRTIGNPGANVLTSAIRGLL